MMSNNSFWMSLFTYAVHDLLSFPLALDCQSWSAVWHSHWWQSIRWNVMNTSAQWCMPGKKSCQFCQTVSWVLASMGLISQLIWCLPHTVSSAKESWINLSLELQDLLCFFWLTFSHLQSYEMKKWTQWPESLGYSCSYCAGWSCWTCYGVCWKPHYETAVLKQMFGLFSLMSACKYWSSKYSRSLFWWLNRDCRIRNHVQWIKDFWSRHHWLFVCSVAPILFHVPKTKTNCKHFCVNELKTKFVTLHCGNMEEEGQNSLSPLSHHGGDYHPATWSLGYAVKRVTKLFCAFQCTDNSLVHDYTLWRDWIYNIMPLHVFLPEPLVTCLNISGCVWVTTTSHPSWLKASVHYILLKHCI